MYICTLYNTEQTKNKLFVYKQRVFKIYQVFGSVTMANRVTTTVVRVHIVVKSCYTHGSIIPLSTTVAVLINGIHCTCMMLRAAKHYCYAALLDRHSNTHKHEVTTVDDKRGKNGGDNIQAVCGLDQVKKQCLIMESHYYCYMESHKMSVAETLSATTEN